MPFLALEQNQYRQVTNLPYFCNQQFEFVCDFIVCDFIVYDSVNGPYNYQRYILTLSFFLSSSLKSRYLYINKYKARYIPKLTLVHKFIVKLRGQMWLWLQNNMDRKSSDAHKNIITPQTSDIIKHTHSSALSQTLTWFWHTHTHTYACAFMATRTSY